MAGYTATDDRGQNWHIAGVWRKPITWEQANALAALAPPATVPFLGAIPRTALEGYAEADG